MSNSNNMTGLQEEIHKKNNNPDLLVMNLNELGSFGI